MRNASHADGAAGCRPLASLRLADVRLHAGGLFPTQVASLDRLGRRIVFLNSVERFCLIRGVKHPYSEVTQKERPEAHV